MRRLCLVVGALSVLSNSALAYESKYNISAVEKAACATDAMRLCSHTYPDEDRLLGCMRGNLLNLSLVCSVTFKAGLKKRNLL